MRLTQSRPSVTRRVKVALLLPALFTLTSAFTLAFAWHVGVAQQTAVTGDATAKTPPAFVQSSSSATGPMKGVTPPQIIYSVDPKFPAAEMKQKGPFSGVCVVVCKIDEHGKVHDVHVVRSLSPGFDREAIKAVEQYRFKPATKDGKPVAVTIHIEVNFKRY